MAIMEAAEEVITGELDAHFVVDVFQTGSGTSTNMNANEVIANGGPLRCWAQQSESGRCIPTITSISASRATMSSPPLCIWRRPWNPAALIPALHELQEALGEKSGDFDDIVKIGRTHLQDAVPIRLGQVFSGYARQVALSIRRLEGASNGLNELPLGGTAVGHRHQHPSGVCRQGHRRHLAQATGLPLREAANHFEAQAGRDAVVNLSGALKACATSLFKIANDIRFLGSGPRCGLGELELPAVQPGSSIMPGKVNPVMAESLMQVCAQVDRQRRRHRPVAGLSGNFELNVMMPVMSHNLLQSIELLTPRRATFSARCIQGLAANRERCEALVEQSLAMVTALAPVAGL
jgi:fumarate hydratase, class II